MEITEWTTSGGSSDLAKHVTSYRDIFMKCSSVCHEIYITAKADSGKTIFAKRLCIVWCYSKGGPRTGTKTITERESEMLNSFEFLFFISLRCTRGNDCQLDDLIFSQVLGQLSRAGDYKLSFLKRVLRRETCLVILEGLDEWSHPESSSSCSTVTPIPHRTTRPKCTVLSTTRPWKMSVSKMKNSKVDKYITLSRW